MINMYMYLIIPLKKHLANNWQKYVHDQDDQSIDYMLNRFYLTSISESL